MEDFQAPAAREHSRYCQAYVFRWRFTVPREMANSLSSWPCQCGGGPRPWRLVDAQHPALCVVAGDHPWTECDITRPKE